VLTLLALGAVLGPNGLALLTRSVLSLIDPAVPVALAALGVLVAFRLPRRRSGEPALFAAASLESAITGVMVAAGILWLAPSMMTAGTLQLWLIALAAGICSSTSASLPVAESINRPIASRIIDMDVLVPIVVGGLVLAAFRETSVTGALSVAGQACAIALVIAAAAWLLLSKATSETEQRVFGVAALLLIGGAADYLSLSALVSGLVAGTFWHFAGGATRESIERDVRYVQRPLAVLLLLIAGARLDFSADLLWLAVAYIVLRTTGKLVGGFVAARLTRIRAPEGFRLRLISPGIFGVAFALNGLRAIGPEVSPVLFATVVGTVASQLIVNVARSREALE
jgi:hypothetical protein